MAAQRRDVAHWVVQNLHSPQVPRLVQLIESRIELGVRQYGSRLLTHNGRDAVQDALEEALDLLLYVAQALMELRDSRAVDRAQHDALIETFERTRASIQMLLRVQDYRLAERFRHETPSPVGC